MRYPGARLLVMGLFLNMLLGCSGASSGVSIPDPSATPGRTWPCTISMLLPGTTAPYNGPGTCGTGDPPSGADVCRVALPEGGSARGWCMPPAGAVGGTPVPIVPSSPTAFPTPQPTLPPPPTPQPTLPPPPTPQPTIPPPPTSPPIIPPGPVLNPSPPLALASPGTNSPLKANPLIVTLIAASQPTQTITLSEPGYTGVFFVTSSNPNIVSVTPASGPGPFTVTELAGGTAILIFSDSQGNSTNVPVAAD